MPERSSGMLSNHAADRRQSSENTLFSSKHSLNNQKNLPNNQNNSTTRIVFSTTNLHNSNSSKSNQNLKHPLSTPPKPNLSTTLSLSQKLAKPLVFKKQIPTSKHHIFSNVSPPYALNHVSIRQIEVSEETSADNETSNEDTFTGEQSIGSSQLPSEYFYDAREVQFDSDPEGINEVNRRLNTSNLDSIDAKTAYFRSRNKHFEGADEVTT